MPTINHLLNFKSNVMKKTLACILLTCSLNANSHTLLDIYKLALEYDPTIKAQENQMLANKQSVPQSIAAILPTISGSYQTTGTNTETFLGGHYNTQNYSLNLSQAIYRPDLWAQIEQSLHISRQALASYLSATQALIIRVSERYFAVLSAQDNLAFAKGQKKAFSRELEQTSQRFEVGLIPITDVHEAQARLDGAIAREVRALNGVSDEYEKLGEITGVPINEVTSFPNNKYLPLLPPAPNNQAAWVSSANAHNLDVITAKENSLQLKAAKAIQMAGHMPKVDVTAQTGRAISSPPFDSTNFSKSASLNLSVPIFNSGGVHYRVVESSYRHREGLDLLEKQRRSAVSLTRQAYRGVLTRISEVEALKQTVVSNSSALKATQAAYEVGTRTIVDVLDAQTNLLNAERELANSRYNYMLEGLKLKQAAGILKQDDLFEVDNIINGRVK
jgi:outer membrane protein